MDIFRHDKLTPLSSNLDPIADTLNLISVLKSRGYTGDLLKDVHGFVSKAEIEKVVKQIGLHVGIAQELADQAMNSRPESCFLPLYYSCLNLAKVYLFFMGKRMLLESNRRHGASYDDREISKKFLNQEINIFRQGTIPLFYNTMFGVSIPIAGIRVRLEEFYSRITSISAEYYMISGKKLRMVEHTAILVQDDIKGHFLRLDIKPDETFGNIHLNGSQFVAYPGLHKKGDHYETQRQPGLFSIVSTNIKNSVHRNMLSESTDGTKWVSHCPIYKSPILLNEDLCIMLAYFHLSNVVRYNPDHLNKIMDSKYWAILLSLRKHAYCQFLKLMWGNYNKLSFDIK